MKKLVNVVVLLMVSLFIIANTVSAVDITASMTSNVNTVKSGDTFTITLSLSNSEGLNSAKGTITYSSDVIALEEMKAGSNAWSQPSSENKGNGQVNFTIARNSYDVSGNNLIQITFKVKENIEVEQTVISISSLVASNSNFEDVEIPDTSKTIAVELETSSGSDGNTNEDQAGDNGNTSGDPAGDDGNTSGDPEANNGNTSGDPEANNGNSGKKPSSDKDKTTVQTGKLPQTGINGILPIAIITIIAIAAGTYVSYRKYKNM